MRHQRLKVKYIYIYIFQQPGAWCLFFLDTFLKHFILFLAFMNFTCHLCCSVRTPAVIGQAAPRDRTADFLGWTVSLSGSRLLTESLPVRHLPAPRRCIQPWRRLRRRTSTRAVLRSASNTTKRVVSSSSGSMVSSQH